MSGKLAPLHRGLMLCATAALLFAFFVYLLYTVNLLGFPYDYDQGEGFELVDSVFFSRGQLPYRDTEAYPFYASNYPPLFHVMAAPFVWLFGPAYWYGRLLGFVGSLISALAIARAVYRDGGGQKWIALLSGLAFLSSNFVYHIGPLFRQHTMMVTFEVAAVVLLASAFPRRDKGGIALGLLLLLCAGYTKQLAAFSALAVFAWMLLRRPGSALRWLAAFTLAGGLIFLWLNLASGGEWWRQAIVANVNDFIHEQALGLSFLWLKLHLALLVPAALLLLYEMYLDRLSLYSIWFALTALLGGVASGTWGAGDSYFVTSIAAACVLSGIFWSRTLAGSWRMPGFLRGLPLGRVSAIAMLIAPLLYLAYARATLKTPTDGAFSSLATVLGISGNTRDNFYDSATYRVGGYARIGYLLSPDDLAAGDAIVQLILEADKPAMSEDAGFSLAAGRDVISNPTQLRNLHKAGLFKGEALLKMIEEREFGVVILRALFYPPPVLEALDQNYEAGRTIRMNDFDYLILYPRSP